MSLLLEALKKAEKAKEEAQRRAREERPSGEPEELRSEGEAPAEAPGETFAAEPATPAPVVSPVMTRNNLPEISQKLEILSDDLDSPKPAREPSIAPVEPRVSAAAEPAPRPRASAPRPRDDTREEASRASARKVFEAKFREPNPRIPFYLTLGVLGAFGIGTFIYFWIQLRPPAPLVNANPPRQAEPAVTVAEARPAASVETPTNSTVIPGLPSSAPATQPPSAPPAQPVAASPRVPQAPIERVDTPQPKPAPRLAQRVPSTPLVASTAETNAARAAPAVNPRVEAGYAAYVAGNLEGARADYQQALNDDPANRDATLGVAALDVRAGRFEAAEAAYLRLLQADPRDSEAQAALIALRSGRVDPLAAESRLKSMLAVDPKAHALNFALGNQLAQQGRWAEAQAQYFKAFAAEPTNADFAYNLAVSLDHLRQPKQALEYYKHAIALAKARGASFDIAGAEARAAQLSR